MTGSVSPSTGRRYPLTMVCAVFRVARSTVYATSAARPAVTLGKRGPKTVTSDAELVVTIRAVLAATPFHGEGYRKVRARLAHRGLAVGGKRVLRLMRQHQLLAPRRLGPPNGDPAHTGTITTTRPDVMWGTDATRFYTEADGWCWFFGAIDHYSDGHRRLAHRQARRSVGRTGTDAAGRASRLRPVWQRRRARAPDPV